VGVTERLYYDDSYLTEFHAKVIESAGQRVYLDRTAFYPTSGGQPFDLGTIGGVAVDEVIDEGDRIVHIVQSPVSAADVKCGIDWSRRFDHMQQHTGQHVLSAVLSESFGIVTVSFHLGQAASTIDVSATNLDPGTVRAAEQRANEVVFENRPVSISYEHPAEAAGLRKPSEREGILRVVEIEKLDRSACGGTHVRSTGAIGPILVRKLEKIRGNVRIEFLCGGRAVRRARADYEALSEISRLCSASVDETPALVSAQFERAQESEKARRKLAIELAGLRGRNAWQAIEPDSSGVRKLTRNVSALDDETRAEAQGFTSNPKAVFIAISAEPPALMVAASADTGLHSGNLVKQAVAAHGGRGGGNAAIAQGSVPTRDALEAALKQIAQAGC
jgi:alanyl-tRNA synthetase